VHLGELGREGEAGAAGRGGAEFQEVRDEEEFAARVRRAVGVGAGNEVEGGIDGVEGVEGCVFS
jgi:hypothetical protein